MRWLIGVALVAACGSGQSAERVETRPEPPLNLHAVVDNAPPGLTVDDFVLVDQTTEPPVRYPATSVELSSATDPVAVTIMVMADERWMGTDTYLPESDPYYAVGAYKAASLAMDALGAALPPKAIVNVYGYHYDLLWMAGPLQASELTGAALGAQDSFSALYGDALLYSLQQVVGILAEEARPKLHQALVVIGDGAAQEMDAASYLQPIADMLKREEVSVYTLHYTPLPGTAITGAANLQILGISGAFAATSQASMVESAAAIGQAIAEHTGGYRVTFGVYEPPEDFSVFGVEVKGKLIDDFSFPGFE